MGIDVVACSFEDVLELGQFSSLSMFDLLQSNMDKVVAPYLYDTIGAETSAQAVVQACRHRRLSGEVVVGYRYVYPARRDKTWLNSSRSTIKQHIAAQKDPYLAGDMERMSKEGMPYSKWLEMCAKACTLASAGEVKKQKSNVNDVVETYEADHSVIQALKEIQRNVRGYLLPDEE